MKFLKTVKKIKSNNGVLHFSRFAIVETDLFSIYIHRIHKSDRDEHLHNHPWPYLNIILSGSYSEAYKPEEGVCPPVSVEISRNNGSRDVWGLRHVRPGTISVSGTKRYHKIYALRSNKVTSLMIVGRRQPSWGYDLDGIHVDFKAYRALKNQTK